MGLFYPEGWPGIELGWVLRRSRWGQGFATEAARAALEWAWDHVAADHIISLIQPGHLQSIRVADKIGERFERAEVIDGTELHMYGIRRPMKGQACATAGGPLGI